MSDPPPAAAIVHECAPLTAASARDVWGTAAYALIEHDIRCMRCSATIFRCDRGVALARAEGAAWKCYALASVEGEPAT